MELKKLKEIIEKFFIEENELEDIYWLNEEVLSAISSEDEYYINNTYFYLLNMYYLYLDKNKSKEVAYLAYLISYYLFIIVTPFGSELISKKYAQDAVKFDNSERYKEWLEYIKNGN